MESLTERGITALRTGDATSARRLLSAAVRERPDDASAWLWLSGALDDPGQQRYCLERALSLDPSSEPARRGLAELRLRDEGQQPGQATGAAAGSLFTPPIAPVKSESTRLQRARIIPQLALPWLAAALTGISAMLGWAAWAQLGATVGPVALLLTAIVWGAPLGLTGLVLGGVLLRSSGSWLGGRAGAAAVRAALGWAAAPAAWGLLLWGGQLVLLPVAGFGGGGTPLERIIVGVCWVLQGGLWLWAGGRVVYGLGVAHDFGSARALAALLLAAVAMVAAALAILAAAALVIGLRGG